MSRYITLTQDAAAFRVSFDYDASLVSAIKSAVDYKARSFVKENRGGHWVVEASAAAVLAKFAVDHAFSVEETAADKIKTLLSAPSAPAVILPQITARMLQGEIVAFHIRTPGFDMEQNAVIKSAGGAKWNGDGKYWDVPFSRAAITAVEALAHGFGLTIAPDLAQAVNAMLTAQDSVISLSAAHDADIQIPAPDGLAYLGYQKAGIAYAAQKGSCIIGDEPGLGKTIQAIGASNLDPSARRILVICPATLKINWAREWVKWCVKGLRVEIVKNGKPESWPTAADVVVINYDLVGKHGDAIFAQSWDMLIVDEAHNLKNPKTKRTKNILGLRARAGGWEETPIPAKRLLLLTGTAIVNRPIELWTLVSAVNPSRFNNFFAFAKRYCDAKQDGYGWNFSGASNLGELHAELRANCMVRRKKADVLKELPAKTRQIVRVECAAAVKKETKTRDRLTRRLIELEAAKLLAFLGDDRDAYTYAVEDLKSAQATAFTEMSKLRHATALAKLPEVIALVRESLEQGKVILFAHHADVIDSLAAEFGDSAVVIDGRTPFDRRQAAVDRFQTDDSCVVCIASIQAAGVGLTLTASSHVIFAELDWVPGNMTQAEDRAHRIGQRENVLVWHVVADGSIDAHMAKMIVRKQRTIDAALDAGAVEARRVDLPGAVEAEELSPVANVIPEFVTVSSAEVNAWLAQGSAERVDATVARATRRAADRGFGREAAEMTAEQIVAVRVNLGSLVAVCDGAVENDAMGFSGVDARVGHALARLAELEPIQAAYARAMLGKYRRQLGAEAVNAMWS
jgi:superfamily II DNA or RNA helicase